MLKSLVYPFLATAALLTMLSLSTQAQVQLPDYGEPDPMESNRNVPDEFLTKVIQPNGYHLIIHAKGLKFIPHVETVDGYTLFRKNNGGYEYAKAGENGDLVGTGVYAKNPPDRLLSEEKMLKSLPKHIEYTGAKLKQLQSLQSSDIVEVMRDQYMDLFIFRNYHEQPIQDLVKEAKAE